MLVQHNHTLCSLILFCRLDFTKPLSLSEIISRLSHLLNCISYSELLPSVTDAQFTAPSELVSCSDAMFTAPAIIPTLDLLNSDGPP